MSQSSARWRIVWTSLVLVGLVACGGDDSTETTPSTETPGTETSEVALEPIELCFPGQDRRLHVEQAEIAPTETPEARIRAVLERLLAGPDDPTLRAPFPNDVSLSAVYLDPEGRVVVDLTRADGARPPAAGSSEEALIVYSLVNSVLLNTPEASSVVLLWNAQQRSTFAGHLDTSRPLTANLSMVARDS